MIVSSLAVFAALVGCQTILAVKLADRLSPSGTGSHDAAEPVRAQGVARPA